MGLSTPAPSIMLCWGSSRNLISPLLTHRFTDPYGYSNSDSNSNSGSEQRDSFFTNKSAENAESPALLIGSSRPSQPVGLSVSPSSAPDRGSVSIERVQARLGSVCYSPTSLFPATPRVHRSPCFPLPKKLLFLVSLPVSIFDFDFDFDFRFA